MSDEMGFNEQRENQPTVSGHVESVVSSEQYDVVLDR